MGKEEVSSQEINQQCRMKVCFQMPVATLQMKYNEKNQDSRQFSLSRNEHDLAISVSRFNGMGQERRMEDETERWRKEGKA